MPHIEVEAGVKFAPLMVNVKAAPPAIADAGVRLVIAAVSATVAGAKARLTRITTASHRKNEREYCI